MAILEINEENPPERRIEEAVECLRKGGIIIYPTDSVYAIGCDIYNHKGLETICKIKGIKPKQAQFAIICYDLSDISKYARQFDNSVFKLMKKTLPGPYTYILGASHEVPKILQAKKKTIGIRIPENNICRELVRVLGNPIITTSIKDDDDDILEYKTDPELIYDDYKEKVDLIINGGYGNDTPSTVIDCSQGEIEVVREGLGEIYSYL